MPRGRMTAMNIGVLKLMTNRVAKTLRVHLVQTSRFDGIIVSMMSMSLANLLIIRPIGVLSKKDIGARRPFSRIPRCRFREACNAPCAMINAASNTATPATRKKILTWKSNININEYQRTQNKQTRGMNREIHNKCSGPFGMIVRMLRSIQYECGDLFSMNAWGPLRVFGVDTTLKN